MTIPTTFPRRSRLTVLLGLICLLTTLGQPPGVVRAQTKQTPIEALEEALKIASQAVDRDRDKAELERRRLAVQKAVSEITTFGDAAQGLLSYSWRDDPTSAVHREDRDARQKLLDRFLNGVEVVLTTGDDGSRAALATMVGEFAANARSGASATRAGIVQDSYPLLAKHLSNLATKETRPVVQEAAIRALSKVRAAPDLTLSAMQTLLDPKKTSIEVRRAAAESLVDILQPTTGTDRGGAIRTPTAGTGEADIAEFGRAIVLSGVLGLVDSDPEVRRLSLTALEQTSSRAASLLRTSQNVPRGEGRLQEVVRVLWDAVPTLAKVLGDPDPAMRLSAARYLEGVGEIRQRLQGKGPAAEPRPEEKRVELEVPLVILVATSTEAGQGPSILAQAVDGLSERLNDPDQRVRLAAVDALDAMIAARGEIGVQKGVEPAVALRAAQALTRGLGDGNRFVRWGAARTLGHIGPLEGLKSGAVASLMRLLADSDHDVRGAAAQALEHYGPEAAAAVGKLAALVSEGKEPESRLAGIRALVATGKGAGESIQSLGGALGDKNVRIRRAAAEALGRLSGESPAAAQELQVALKDQDAEVRRFASGALLKDRPLP